MKYLFLTTIFFASFSANAADFSLTSNSVKEGGTISINQVYKGFGCEGKNLSPDLSWSNAPAGTKSFAITEYDPDAPTGSGWWHWVAFIFPSSVSSIAEGASGKSMPEGTIESRTDFGEKQYGGSCPPVGDKPHRYQFTVWALDTDKLDLQPKSSAAMVGFFLNQHKLGKASIEAKYGR